MAEYFYGITDKGKRRDKNEDTFFAREIINKRFVVACVIDGVGGYHGGDIAAGIARSVIMKNLETLPEDVIEGLRQAIIAANLKINQEKTASDKNERMACVLSCVIADVKNNKCWYAHVGDTRIYLLRDHSLVKISRDHSTVGFLEESGRLSEEEAMRHPRRNEITKALGFEEDISTPEDFIETGESPFLSGDLLLLCSDGLTDMVSSGTIMSVLTTNKSLSAKAKALVDAANDAGGNDNITAVLVKNNNRPKQKAAPVPIARKNDIDTLPIAVGEPAPVYDIVTAKKNDSSRLTLITFSFIGLMGIFLTLPFQKNNKPAVVKASPALTLKKKNEQLIQLTSHLNDSSATFALQKGTVLEFNDPLLIGKDSFHLAGNSAILIADSTYHGPAVVINSSAKHIVLDSLVFENFDVGIVVQKNNVTFRNVRFVNCRIPVQYVLSFPDTVISGRFKDSIFITH